MMLGYMCVCVCVCMVIYNGTKKKLRKKKGGDIHLQDTCCLSGWYNTS